jgi:hypothetical protein
MQMPCGPVAISVLVGILEIHWTILLASIEMFIEQFFLLVLCDC